MTRGRIVLITENGVITSTEFNGDMYYDWHGKNVIAALNEVHTEQEYREFVEKFNAENFEYEEELFYDARMVDVYNNGTYETKMLKEEELFDFTKDYFGKWGSDYLYIKNIRNSAVKMVDSNNTGLMIESGGFVMLHYGSYTEESIEYSVSVSVELSEKFIEVCENLDWKVTVCDDYVELEKYSPAGEDFFFTVNIVNFVREVEEYAYNFDADEHAEMWVEGRGTRGIPSSIRELINDADDIQDMLNELAEALRAVIEEKSE